jgi:hypothetical protein
MEDSGRYGTYADKYSLPKGNLWDNKEERRTISGYIDPGIYDPICDNCFHLYESIANPSRYHSPKPRSTTYRLIMAKPPSHQVTTKTIPYRPRLGHIGYAKGDNRYSNAELQQFYKTLNFDLAWPRKYMIE